MRISSFFSPGLVPAWNVEDRPAFWYETDRDARDSYVDGASLTAPVGRLECDRSGVGGVRGRSGRWEASDQRAQEVEKMKGLEVVKRKRLALEEEE